MFKFATLYLLETSEGQGRAGQQAGQGKKEEVGPGRTSKGWAGKEGRPRSAAGEGRPGQGAGARSAELLRSNSAQQRSGTAAQQANRPAIRDTIPWAGAGGWWLVCGRHSAWVTWLNAC